MNTSNVPHRRQFVRAALATAASYGRILGANERIRIGAIGTGGRGQYLLSQLKLAEQNEIVACCDVYEPRRLEAKSKYATPDASDHLDYREILDRRDIDAVVIATPDHWHVPLTIAAVRAGKDVYCEKPITHSIEEGAGLIGAVHDSKRVVQIGLQQRSWEHFAQARQEILDGRLGQVTMIRTYWFQNHIPSMGRVPSFDMSKLDWKRFLGSATDRPFDPDQFGNWRWYWDFGGGAMTDLFVHWVDVAHWIMNDDTPTRATATGLKAVLVQRQTPDTMSASLAYGKVVVEFDSALLGYIEGGGLMIRGTKAAMRLWRGGFAVYGELNRYSENPEPSNPMMEVKSKQDGTLPHMKNFLECVRTRATPNAHVEIGVSAARAGHVANIAMRGSGVWMDNSVMRTTLFCTAVFCALAHGADPNAIDLKAPEIKLWPKGAPGSEGVTAAEEWIPTTDGFHRVRNIHQPSLTVFLPDKGKATGVGYVICPGGGHNYLVMDLEGANVARILNNMGIAAFILKSRLANTKDYHYKVDVESLADAQRALRTVRARAREWGVDTAHVGIMGFSAGGELAAYAETRWDRGKADSADPVERQSSRPDFAVLGYPGGKAANLTVTKETPATFIVVNNDDNLAPASADYYAAIRRAGVPVELHVYNRGGHGFGMTGRTLAFAQLPVSGWPVRFQEWMVDMGFLPR